MKTSSNSPAQSGRAAVLAALRHVDAAWPVQHVAELVGLSASTTRFHLDRLVDDGLVSAEKEPRTTPGRRRLLYRAAPLEAVDDAAAYRALAQLLAEALAEEGHEAAEGAAAAAEQAGRRWARSVLPARLAAPSSDAGDERDRALGEAVALLADHGFAPELDDGHHAVRLHRCPFREVAQAQPGVVCSVHLGLLREALDRLGAPMAATAIEPVLDGSMPCVAHLAAREEA